MPVFLVLDPGALALRVIHSHVCYARQYIFPQLRYVWQMQVNDLCAYWFILQRFGDALFGRPDAQARQRQSFE